MFVVELLLFAECCLLYAAFCCVTCVVCCVLFGDGACCWLLVAYWLLLVGCSLWCFVEVRCYGRVACYLLFWDFGECVLLVVC